MRGLRRRTDMVFPTERIAVFVDGCYWHGCPEHGSGPKTNAEYWEDKIQRNRARGIDTNLRLAAEGWRVLRIWEHDDVELTALAIQGAVLAARQSSECSGGDD